MSAATPATAGALRVRVRGVVQGVGFRPFVYRLAHASRLRGWVLNGENGVEIHAEGDVEALQRFVAALESEAPPAARIASIETEEARSEGFAEFAIRASEAQAHPTVRVSPDLPVCDDCLRELFDPNDRRYRYPYVNCTNCGPRYSIVLSLPYDRPRTTMREWPLCAACEREYRDPLDRRFHAQPVACAACGPNYVLRGDGGAGVTPPRADAAIARAAALLREGSILAIKGVGGYHLACDARNACAVAALRARKFRKERPFALMARDLDAARALAEVSTEEEALLTSVRRPIVLLRARRRLDGVAPENDELGVMLPYAPLHHLLFADGCPEALVMTSANRSSEPIAYEDADAFARLDGIADAFLVGERAIARRVDDAVARAGPRGPAVLRHARGYAPQAVATLRTMRPILSVGADLKSAIALVVDGQVFASQHIGDLEHLFAFESFEATVRDLCAMYEVRADDLVVAHDLHPEYRSTQFAQTLPGTHVAVQHHRAHVASALAETGALEEPVIGIAFDGTGYGDDGTIWGGEFFTGSVRDGFTRAMHLRPGLLPGGDAAARFPVQAAAGFLAGLDDLPDLSAPPFAFPDRYDKATRLLRSGVRTFATTSAGRLFDTVAALCGFTRPVTYEAQAATWLETLARRASVAHGLRPYAMIARDGELDYRPALRAAAADRVRGRDPAEIARAFHVALADGIAAACAVLDAGASRKVERIVASGGVLQNALLAELLTERLGDRLLLNAAVPCNDGGLCVGQAALAAASLRA